MLNLDLSGRTALVTGSTGGIGLAIARKLGETGATVIINGRKQDSIDGARPLNGTRGGVRAETPPEQHPASHGHGR